jgi:hypothetical protein
MVKKYFGLSGQALNWAIGAVAGCDFLLFGYGMRPRLRITGPTTDNL